MNSRICVNFFLIPLIILNLDKHEYASLNEFEYVILNMVHVTPQIFYDIFSIYIFLFGGQGLNPELAYNMHCPYQLN